MQRHRARHRLRAARERLVAECRVNIGRDVRPQRRLQGQLRRLPGIGFVGIHDPACCRNGWAVRSRARSNDPRTATTMSASDVQERIAQLQDRACRPACWRRRARSRRKSPDELLAELDRRCDELQTLITQINHTNAGTRLATDEIITEGRRSTVAFATTGRPARKSTTPTTPSHRHRARGTATPHEQNGKSARGLVPLHSAYRCARR